MLSSPNQAVIGGATVASGAQTNAVLVASVSTTTPSGAPTVTGVSGTVTNDTATTIHVFGSNFASGALVRIGSMTPLNATVNSSTDLQVTVPVNAPAAPNLDVIVTNPAIQRPPAQQNQSGLLAGGLTIKATSQFQTSYQFASRNAADGSISVFDATQRAMVSMSSSATLAQTGLAFNASGADVYSVSGGLSAVALNLATDGVTSIALHTNKQGLYQALARSVNPSTGRSVVDEWSGVGDISVNMIDADPSSPTFNTVIRTLNAGLPSGSYLPLAGAATPNGKFVYVGYQDTSGSQFAIAIFDVVHGGPATILSTSSLGVSDYQYDMYVTSDGGSLLLQAYYNHFGGLGIAVFDITGNPLNPTRITTIRGTSPRHVGGAGASFLFSYQVVGTRLFAMDTTNRMLYAFNFDRQHSNYAQLGAVRWQGNVVNPYLAVSPDGNLIYVPFAGDDVISIYNANRLASGQSAFVTNLANFHGPSAIGVSPVNGSDLSGRWWRGMVQRNRPAQ